MRLNHHQIQTIKETIKGYLGESARVWLFGSRVNDDQRGGDIDLFIETTTPLTEDRWHIEASIDLALQKALGEQKLDILLHTATDKTLPIHLIAKQTGIEL